jgi:hypothetical protein
MEKKRGRRSTVHSSQSMVDRKRCNREVHEEETHCGVSP